MEQSNFSFLKSCYFSLLTRLRRYESSEKYIRRQYKKWVGCEPNLENPKKFTEKLQWYKINYHDPLMTQLVDKFAVKDFVSQRIGAEYVIPCYGKWDSFDEIDFSSLPETFVLKTNNDSGSILICKDKKNFDFANAKRVLEAGLKRNYYWINREWAYKDVKSCILAEEYMPSLGNVDSVEYKITCINGEVKVITVCTGIPHSTFDVRHNDNFSRDWVRQPWYVYHKPLGGNIPKPVMMDKMIELSELLAKDIPQVRIDWYIIDDSIFFGEFTFYTWGGYMRYEPEEWNDIMGEWFTLPSIKK